LATSKRGNIQKYKEFSGDRSIIMGDYEKDVEFDKKFGML
jgi:hypothetical protein